MRHIESKLVCDLCDKAVENIHAEYYPVNWRVVSLSFHTKDSTKKVVRVHTYDICDECGSGRSDPEIKTIFHRVWAKVYGRKKL